MSITETAVQFMIDTALDDSHGYDQAQRWSPNYDCSSLVITAWKQAGLPLTCCTTRDMYGNMVANGFRRLSPIEEIKRGDVLLNREHHTAMYIGDGELVHASINENGEITGGKTGDQTGKEICIAPYYDYPWTDILRYAPEENADNDPQQDDGASSIELPLLKFNSKGSAVASMQAMLQYHGINVGRWGIDGDFGNDTYTALVNFQYAHQEELTACTGVCDTQTWQLLYKL